MPSKTSLFSQGFLKNNFKKYSWVAYAYTLVLFFAIPLRILMQLSNEEIDKEFYVNIFLLINQGISILALIIAPIIMGLVLFQYLHAKESADTLHSLPVQRSTLYRTHMLTGIILLILPLLVTSALSILINLFLNLGDYYTIVDVIRWFCYTSLLSISIFFTCVVVGMFTGSAIAQGVLTFIFLLFPASIIVLIVSTLSYLIYGFYYNISFSMVYLSPINRVMAGFYPLKDMAMGGTEICVYLILYIVFFVLANYLYKIRNLENAGQAIVFPKLHIPFKYGVTFCTMLIGGLYFYSMQETLAWTIFGYFVGSLLGYLIAEIILNKSLNFFKNTKSMKGYLIFAGITIICLLFIRCDFWGFEKRQPDLAEVDKIYFGDGFFDNPKEMEKRFFTEQDNLENIYQLHQEVIQNKNDYYFNKKQMHQGQSATFIYQLKNGRTMSRGYTVVYNDYAQFLKPLYESKQYKYMNYDILNVDLADVEKITIEPTMYSSNTKETVILKPDEIESMLNVMKQDTLSRTYEQMQSQQVSWASVKLLISENKTLKYPTLARAAEYDKYYDHHIYDGWQKTDTNLENWLKEKNYYAQARIFPEDISFITVEKVNNQADLDLIYQRQYGNSAASVTEEEGMQIIIKDKNQIETCLQEYIYDGNLYYQSGYFINYYSEDNYPCGSGAFLEDSAPSFIKNLF